MTNIGERNNYLYKYALKEIKLGISKKEVLSMLYAKNNKDCRPPLSKNEVTAIIKNIEGEFNG